MVCIPRSLFRSCSAAQRCRAIGVGSRLCLMKLEGVGQQLGGLVDVLAGEARAQVGIAVQRGLHERVMLTGDVTPELGSREGAGPAAVKLRGLAEARRHLEQARTRTGAQQSPVELGVRASPLFGDGLALLVNPLGRADQSVMAGNDTRLVLDVGVIDRVLDRGSLD